MSIHILNLLIELSEISNDTPGACFSLATMQHALGHTDAGDALDYNDYRALVTSRSINEFQVIARALLPKYRRIHTFLGCPANADAWRFARLKFPYDQDPLRTQYRALLWDATLPTPLYWRT